ncbi:MAG: N-acetylmuramoyl-L-alanine amidase [Candidatus Aminicenantes bacterium]
MISLKKRSTQITGAVLLFVLLSVGSVSQIQPFLKLSVRDYEEYSRVIIAPSFPLSFEIEKGSSFLLVKIAIDIPFRIQKESFDSHIVKSFGWTKGRDYYILTIKTKIRDFSYDYFVISDPTQLVIDFREGGDESRGDREIRSLLDSALSREGEQPSGEEIQTIVIDPGHGGRMEPGAQGKYGVLEKDITLALALKLRDVIERNRPVRVVLTRDTDVSVSLENRAAIANTNKADLFISIHVNSSYRKEARGSETFFLGAEASDDETRRLAYLENNPAEVDKGIGGDNEDEITMILWDMAQSAYLKESSLLAETIQEELNHLLGTRNRGIKQIPFKVLTGVACPAVLVEVAFISNPDEERKLQTEWFQNNVVEAIYRGVESYIDRYTRR